MASKFELSISTQYVPDWGIVEALRELFQNALDNQTVNPDNKMGWYYDKISGEVRISNKTSKLEAESLLLGSGTKHDRTDTIGKHGEGYKIAFMVLLRNGKTVKVENYGANEVWYVRLVKSRKYKGQLVPTVLINKEPVWKKKPSSDLTIVVGGITEEEYTELKKKNLHLRGEEPDIIGKSDRGSILADEAERGNIYVEGLYVTHIDELHYGYNFSSSVISLDRDRKLVDSFNVKWSASELWCRVSTDSTEATELAVELVNESAADTAYLDHMPFYGNTLFNAIADNFYEINGGNAVPVTSNLEYEAVQKSESGKPVIVTAELASILRSDYIEDEKKAIKVASVREQLLQFVDKIADRLSDEELDEISNLIDKVNN